MDTHQLRCFISVAQTLNFTEAAKQNYITQPAISRKMQELEEQLGAKLFLRDKHSVRLTGEGMEFYQYATEILEIEEDAKVRIRNLVQGRAGHIKISMVSSSSFDFVRCMARFSERYPLIQVSVDRLPGREHRQTLLEREHDFYFTTDLSLPTARRISHIITEPEPFVLVFHARYADQIDPGDFSSLANKPFAYFPRAVGPILYDKTMAICHARGYAPGIMNYYNCGEAVVLSVAAGAGVSILPSSVVNSCYIPGILTLPIPGDDAHYFNAIAWKQDQTNTAAAKFLEVVRELYPNG